AGQGQEITYTLSYSNSGSAAARDVAVSFESYGLSGLADLALADIGPGESGSVTFIVTVVDGHSAELMATISEARHGAYDWIWAQHRIDTVGPDLLTIDRPEKYLAPGPNLFSGQVHDSSGISGIALKFGNQDQECPGPEPGDAFWSCPINVPDLDAAYPVQAMATDLFGNTREWTEEKVLILDNEPPTVLAVSVKSSSKNAISSLPFTYTVVVENLGPGIALDAWLEITLPDLVPGPGAVTGTMRLELDQSGLKQWTTPVRVEVPMEVTGSLTLMVEAGRRPGKVKRPGKT
ncbi:MAG: hypothetical protein ACK2UH_16465, partial [Candidatus Promineifilaceae bacterium]